MTQILLWIAAFIFLTVPLHAEVLLQTENGRRIELKKRDLPLRYNECHLCHTPKKREFMSKKTKTQMEHTNRTRMHGKAEMLCHNCHDINKSDYLRQNGPIAVSFENSSGVCQRCHPDRYLDWKSNMHGKRLGLWNGDAFQFQCIDCHDPHSVSIKKMDSLDIRSRPKFLIDKDSENSEPR